MTTIWSVIREHMLDEQVRGNQTNTKKIFKALKKVYRKYDRATFHKRMYALRMEGLIKRTKTGTYVLTEKGELDINAHLMGGAKAKANREGTICAEKPKKTSTGLFLKLDTPEGQMIIPAERVAETLKDLAAWRNSAIATIQATYDENVRTAVTFLANHSDRDELINKIIAKITTV